jgi:hypothetical protein
LKHETKLKLRTVSLNRNETGPPFRLYVYIHHC